MVWKNEEQKIITEQNERAIFLYIKNKIKEGHKYFQSHKIANDMGLSSKFIGTVLYKFSQLNDTKLKITQYARSNSRLTWLIEEKKS
jgi:hypothetical protein